MVKGKKQSTGPKRKRLNREQRLQSAKSWLETYAGKNIVKAYRRHYGVDWRTAFTELEMLGVDIDPEYKKRLLQSLENQAAARQRKKAEGVVESESVPGDLQDEHFAFIAGYTSGGAPYGLTWEEWEALEESEEEQTDPCE